MESLVKKWRKEAAKLRREGRWIIRPEIKLRIATLRQCARELDARKKLVKEQGLP